ncbi:MAG: hypothetical protein JXB49_32230, partial [Bacteroidales bacterium]|nr:hypothetical protein [Bacteroidales bacterium]
MKKHLLLKIAIAAVIVAFCTSLRAEEITLDPSALIPADTGYYIGGVWKDENEDGIDEFYNGCLDYYDDAHHNENGKQQGFTYAKCMIMPDCWAKNADDELTHELSLVAQGYIEIGKTRYLNTDSARMCYIICPYLENLEKLYIEASPDVSSNEQRHIWFYIQYSTDQGNTWVEDLFIKDETISKFGDLH